MVARAVAAHYARRETVDEARKDVMVVPFGDFCPACGSGDVDPVRGHRGDTDPGEVADFHCGDCGHVFVAIVPEPPSDYEGDGVFAPNH